MQPGTKVAAGLVGSCVLTLLILVAALAERHQASTQSLPEPSLPQTTQEEPTIRVEAIWIAYSQNEIAAERLYAGKTIGVVGTVGRVESDGDFGVILFPASSGGIFGVRCYFAPQYKDTLAELRADQSILLRGLVTGYSHNNVTMRDCYILRR